MKIAELIQTLQSKGVRLFLKDGGLGFKAPKGVLTGDLLAAVKANKSALIELLQDREQNRGGSVIAKQPRNEPLPLSFAQRRLWFVEQLEGPSRMHILPLNMRLRGDLDTSVLETALQQVVERHESLRLAIHLVDKEPMQSVRDADAFGLPLVDISGLPAADRESLANLLSDRASARPFDLAQDYLLRALVIRVNLREHAVVAAMHHIAADGWSLGILMQEFGAGYRAGVLGEALNLPPLPVQYPDYAVWQREQLGSQGLQTQQAYWQGQLADLPAVHGLDLDRPRPQRPAHRGKTWQGEVPPAVTSGLRGLARQTESTLFMVLQAAFAALQYRYSDRDDIITGTPVANRGVSGIDGLIGLFLNNLVIRCQVNGGESFMDLLQRTRRVVSEAFANQDIPFETLVEMLKPERALNQHPLYQIKFGLQNQDEGGMDLPGLAPIPAGSGETLAKLDLSLDMMDSDATLETAWIFDAELFDRDTVVAMDRAFVALLQGVVADASATVDTLPLLSEATRQQLLQTWSGIAVADAGALSKQPIHQVVAGHALQRPDAVAAVDGARHVTYAVLQDRSARFAARLAEVGGGPEMLVGVFLPRGVAWLVAVLGILQRGAAYVPFDPRYTGTRLVEMLGDAGIALVAASEATEGDLPEVGAWVLIVDETTDHAPMRAAPVAINQPAYAVYTSGSTGVPKGVLLSHGGLANLATAQSAAFSVQAHSRVAHYASPSFDAATSEWAMALVQGATLVTVDADTARNPAGLTVLLRQAAVSHATLPPAMVATLDPMACRGLAHLIVAGEACPNVLAQQWAVGREMYNAYGPSEVTVCASISPIREDVQRVTIGKAMAGMTVYVCDRQGHLVAPGVAGELRVAGQGLAYGYLYRPGLTAASFLPNPFAERPGARLYATGDRVRFNGAGELIFLGRVDRQLKLRGFRVEPGEIEAKLAQHADVAEAVVLPSKDRSQLLAFVRVAASVGQTRAVNDDQAGMEILDQPDADTLRHHLSERVPTYMMPARFTALRAWPLNRSGKVDRRALRQLEKPAQTVTEQPVTETEKTLAELWADILGLNAVGATTHFFEAGGHSLLAVDLLSRIQARFGVAMEIPELFEAPILRDLAKRVDALAADDNALQLPPIEVVDRAGPLPLSFAQRRLWFLDNLEGPSPLYNIPTALGLHGPLSVRALEDALTGVMARHESLRTHFTTDDGQPQLVVQPLAPLNLTVIDLKGLPTAKREELVQSLAAVEARRPFNLSGDVMLRPQLVRTGMEDHLLSATMHHTAADGWSVGVLTREFAALYAAALRGQRAVLPDLPIQYTDYAAWQHRWMTGEALDRLFAFWRDYLKQAPVVHQLPLDRPRPRRQSFRGGQAYGHLDGSVTQKLKTIAKNSEATLFMVLQAAFSVFVARLSGQTDVVLGTPTANRARPELTPLIGFFVNTLVLRNRVAGHRSFTDLIAHTREQTLQAFAHQDMPFEMLVDELAPARDLAHHPLFQIMFSLDTHGDTDLSLPGLSLSGAGAAEPMARFDLTLMMEEGPEGLSTRWEYAADLFEPETVANMNLVWNRLLTAIAEKPQQSPRRLPLMNEEEQRAVLAQCLGPVEPLPDRGGMAWVIWSVAQQQPDAIALVDGDVQLTYDALWRAASLRMAQMRYLNVQRGQVVGLALDRGCERFISALAVLAQGAAYLPLDPIYPNRRLADMVRDTRPVCIVYDAYEPHYAEDVFTMEVVPPTPAALAREPQPPLAMSAHEAAYMIYTSGSTGRPKGAVLTHGGLVNLSAQQAKLLQVGSRSRILQFSAFGFDATTWEWVMAHGNGAAFVIPDVEVTWEPHLMVRFLNREYISHATIPPVLLGQMNPLRTHRPDCLIAAGEAFSLARALRWSRGRTFVNAYGPTETTVCAALGMVSPDAQQLDFGHPLGNLRCLVVDEWGQCLPDGAVGELWVGGPALARGYHARPALTAAVFVPDAYSSTPGERLYRTGDLVRRVPRMGGLVFVGRRDNQVKLRGFRLELGDVEAQMQALESVREAKAVIHRDSEGTERLLAYVVGHDSELDHQHIIDQLHQRLPSYQVPAQVIVLGEMPLTPSGKINVKALPDPQRQTVTMMVPPSDEVEQTLHDIWQSVLRADRIGVTDNFFRVGGDSILAIQLVSRANQAGLTISTRDVFECQTIRLLAQRAQQATSQKRVAAPSRGRLDLLPIQQRFFADESPAAHHFNQAMCFETPIEAGVDFFRALVDAWYEQHPVLRLQFRATPQAVVAEFADNWDVDAVFQVVDWEPSSFTSVCEAAQTSLNLADGPLWRLVYFRGNNESGRLLILAHHLVVDAVSWQILGEELQQAWLGYINHGEIHWAPERTSFQEWAEELTARAQQLVNSDEYRYWQAIAKADVPPLPAPPGTNRFADEAVLDVALDSNLTEELLADALLPYNSRPEELLLAALALAFFRWTGQRVLRPEFEGHGREDRHSDYDLSHTLGWFTAAYPVLLQLDDPTDLTRSIIQVKEAVRQVPDRGMGYGLLQAYANDPQLPMTVIQDVGFNYLGHLGGGDAEVFDEANAPTFGPAREDGGAAVANERQRWQRLGFTGYVRDGQLHLSLAYDRSQFNAETMQQLGGLCVAALQDVVNHCVDAPIGQWSPSDFQLVNLTQSQLDDLLVEYPGFQDIYACTPMQRGLLYHTAHDEASAYVSQSQFSFQGDFQVVNFRDAWDTVIDRHAVLRTAFVELAGGELVQVLMTVADMPWRKVDLRGQADWQNRYLVLQQEERQQPFDLTQPPLMRGCLIQADDRQWRFIWTFHHALMDGWSLNQVMNEVMLEYAQLVTGQNQPYEPARPFRDYVAWLKNRQDTGALPFWQSLLADFSEPVNLPWMRTMQTTDDHYREDVVQLSGDISERLHAFVREHDITMNTLLQAMWGELLRRYSGQEDILFGVTLSGRPAELVGVERMVGLFINTVPMRLPQPLDDTGAWLRATHQRSLAVQDHGYLPLTRLQQLSAVPAGQAMFDSLVVFENYPFATAGASDTVSEIEPETDAADASQGGGLSLQDASAFEHTHYGVTLSAADGHQFAFKLNYNAARVDMPTITAVGRHLDTLLRGVLDGAHLPPHALPMLSVEERRCLLDDWCGTGDTGTPSSVLMSLWQQVQQESTATLVWHGQRLSLADCLAQAHNLALALGERGVRPGDRVVLVTDRVLAWPVALLGIWWAGAVVVPCDVQLPTARVTFMAADAAARVVLAADPTIYADERWQTLSLMLAESVAAPSTRPPHTLGPAYRIYTSGSTGQPKAVAVDHRALAIVLHEAVNCFGLDQHSVMPCLASPGFDIAMFELFLPLLAGGTAQLVPADTVEDLDALAATLAPITHLHAVPALMASLLNHYQTRTDINKPALRQLFVGGDAVPHELPQRLHDGWPEATICELYGPTEATIIACAWQAAVGEPLRSGQDIGRPLAWAQTYVLNPQLEPVPMGAVGHLYLGGTTLASGYVGQPRLTAKSFVPHPFTDQPGARLYHSGDLVRYDQHGHLTFMGRADTQLKLRGFRIEAGEIEARLEQIDEITGAVVVLRGVGDRARLVAYLTGSSLPEEQLRQALHQWLPDYMVPHQYQWLDAFPTTVHHKVDRKALPEPSQDSEDQDLPATPQEARLLSMYKELLGENQVSVLDDFFALGGHSLLATQLVSRLRAEWQLDVPIRTIFNTPRIRDLARVLSSLPTLDAPPLTPVSRDKPLPLSFAQERLYFIDRFQGPHAAYNLPISLRFQGHLDSDVLEAAFATVVSRHESLRTLFQEREGTARQVILPAPQSLLTLVDLRPMATAVREQAVADLVAHEASRPFHLQRDIPIRLTLLRCDDHEYRLLLTLHHIASDGWSMGLLTREVGIAYSAHFAGGTPALPPLPLQVADHAAWQRRWLQGRVLDRQVAYWRKRLQSLPPVHQLATDRPRPAQQTFHGAVLQHPIDQAVAQQVRALAQAENATLFMVLQTAFAALIARESHQTDIALGTPVANRTHVDLERLIGFFVNTLVLRTDLSGDPGFRQLLAQVRETTLADFNHGEVPFELLVDRLAPQRDLSYSPLFQLMFALHNHQQGAGSGGDAELDQTAQMPLPGVTLRPEKPHETTAKFDLTLTCVEESEGLATRWEYNTDLFDRTTIAAMAARFARLLEQVIDTPDQNLWHLDLLDEHQRQLLVRQWNDTERAVDQQRALTQRVAQVAQDHPDRLALVQAQSHVTFAVLHQHALALAATLRQHGVQPEQPVGLSVDRSPAMAAGVLGILYAGAACVPLDPAYPAKRLAFIMAEAGISLLVAGEREVAQLPKTPVTRIDPAFQMDAPPLTEPAAVEPEQTFYLIYTSGSTGRPKGIALPHRAMTNLVDWHSRHLPDTGGFLQFASISFDASFHELFSAWDQAQPAFLIPESWRRDPVRLVQYIADWRIPKLNLPVVLFQQLAEMHEREPHLFSHLRHVIATGEQLLLNRHVKRMFTALPHCTLNNHYGPSETHVVTALTFSGEPEQWPYHAPLGGPIDNCTVYLVDRYLQLVPPGVPGEAFLGGDHPARGYLGRPALTAARFVPDPWSRLPGARMYRSGDLMRHRDQGVLHFLGRVDFQVKVRGFRVELGEIEACLLQHEAVNETLVMVREDQPGDKRLAAYVVPVQKRRQDSALAEQLLAHVRAQLPDYMVPVVVLLDAFPMTPNRKIDRQALPAPQTMAESAPYRAPRNDMERVLVQAWSDVLQRDKVGIDDDFFNLGGNSILSLRVLAVAERQGLHIRPKQLFEHRTPAGLAAAIASSVSANDKPLAVAPIDSLVTLRQGDSRQTPLYCIHPGGGNVLCYQSMVTAVPGQRPVMGIQARGLDDGAQPFDRLADMAAWYLRAIRAHQPHGAIHLLGWSMGGTIAFEMARQHVQTGGQVGSLIVLEGVLPQGDDLDFVDIVKRKWGDHPQLQQDNLHNQSVEALLDHLVALSDQREDLPPDLTPAQLRRYIRYNVAAEQALKNYAPRDYDGQVHLVVGDASDFHTAMGMPEDLGWSQLSTAQIQRHTWRGDHNQLIEPINHQRLSQLLTTVLPQG